VEEAKQVLEVEGMDVGAIAASVRDQDPTSFCRVFKRMAGLTSAANRRKFAPPTRVRWASTAHSSPSPEGVILIEPHWKQRSSQSPIYAAM
jgi:AraC-like DNA-binding protein